MERRVSVGAARVGRGSQGEQSGNNLDGELKMFEKDFFGNQQIQRLCVCLGRKENTFGSSAAQATCKRFLPVSEQTLKGSLILEVDTMPLLLSSVSKVHLLREVVHPAASKNASHFPFLQPT